MRNEFWRRATEDILSARENQLANQRRHLEAVRSRDPKDTTLIFPSSPAEQVVSILRTEAAIADIKTAGGLEFNMVNTLVNRISGEVEDGVLDLSVDYTGAPEARGVHSGTYKGESLTPPAAKVLWDRFGVPATDIYYRALKIAQAEHSGK